MDENTHFLEIQNLISNILKQEIVQSLLKHSNFTKTQLETLLLDFYARHFFQKDVQHEKLARMRNVARGSFSRVLHQGRKNYIKSAYSILLLIYLGFFEDEPFRALIDLNNEIVQFATQYDDLHLDQNQLDQEELQKRIKALNDLEIKIKTKIEELAKPKTIF
ncbi:MAG: hypothetical protein ACTSRW_05175 [Candidatus Helarchaeota archaeon]